MDRRSLRIGITAVLFAFIFRLWATGLPAKVTSWLLEPNTASFLIYLETGRNVRFSASQEAFLTFPAESPAPWFSYKPQEPEKPVFSQEDASLVDIYYACTHRPDLSALLEQPLSWDLTGPEPSVLILHTHTTESYTQLDENYVETSDYRTLDENYNMLSVGTLVAQLLAEKGITAVQDRSFHDYPSYNGSYVDARKSLTEYLEQYPSVKLVLDLHRDASGGSGGQLRTFAQVDGEPSAQLMLVMGTNYDRWEENLALGLKLHAQLERQAPGIMRPLSLRAQRFNQDLCPGALLIEVGAAGNTHPEAVTAARQLAQAIVALAKGTGELEVKS